MRVFIFTTMLFKPNMQSAQEHHSDRSSFTTTERLYWWQRLKTEKRRGKSAGGGCGSGREGVSHGSARGGHAGVVPPSPPSPLSLLSPLQQDPASPQALQGHQNHPRSHKGIGTRTERVLPWGCGCAGPHSCTCLGISPGPRKSKLI